MKFILYAWCPDCHRFVRARIGPDGRNPGRITEILKRHRTGRWSLLPCSGAGLDADPVR